MSETQTHSYDKTDEPIISFPSLKLDQVIKLLSESGYTRSDDNPLSKYTTPSQQTFILVKRPNGVAYDVKNAPDDQPNVQMDVTSVTPLIMLLLTNKIEVTMPVTWGGTHD
jgi:hypothetical protein